MDARLTRKFLSRRLGRGGLVDVARGKDDSEELLRPWSTPRPEPPPNRIEHIHPFREPTRTCVLNIFITQNMLFIKR